MAREDDIAAAAAAATSVKTGNTGSVNSSDEAAGTQDVKVVVSQETTSESAEAAAPVSPAVAQTEQPSAAEQPSASASAPSDVKVRETTAVDQVAGTQQSAPRKGSNTALTVMAQWDAYQERAAANKPQTSSSINMLCDELINLITRTVNLPETADFVQVSNYLLKEIQADRTGALSMKHVQRGFNVLPAAKIEKVRFALDAYFCFADPKTRAVNIGPYNLTNAARLASTPELRDRFVAYFNRISGSR